MSAHAKLVDTLPILMVCVRPPLQEISMKKHSPFGMPPTASERTDNRLKFAHFASLGQGILREQVSGMTRLRILDIGCGPGNLAFFCEAQAQCRLFGVDLWQNQLRQAAEKEAYEALFQVNLIDGLPFMSESFDIIVCNEVLMYLPNATEILTEFYRVLAPDGKLFVYNPINWLPRLHSAIKKLTRRIYQEKRTVVLDVQSNWKEAERACRITFYSFKSLIEQIRSVNFDIAEIAGFRLFRNRIRLMTRLENYAWYRRLVLFLTERYPHMASDLFVLGHKKALADQKNLSTDKAAA
jgi:ubiquinone/menaquinone biosynthesis C-methylase UbiE